MPLPPAFMLTLWGNDEAFIEKYLAETPGYYTTGDAGVFDEHGYLHIMTRVDDVINTCGHRISTGRLEEVINDHDQVVESAVVGYNEPLRGEMPLAYVVLRGEGAEVMDQATIMKLKTEINNKVRKEVGAFANMIGVIFMKVLPKTRSGKILRGTIRKISNRNEWKMPATIDDATSIEAIGKASLEWMEALPEDRRIKTDKRFMTGFTFVTNTKINDEE
jgi:propionyl-CoA synthetase